VDALAGERRETAYRLAREKRRERLGEGGAGEQTNPWRRSLEILEPENVRIK
jgi:hypothetical protein